MPSECRYKEVSRLADNRGRQTCLAEDLFTGRRVVLKCGPLDSIRREAACLLSLSPGVGPRLLDLDWMGSGCLTLAREYLEGTTLDKAAGDLSALQIPALAQALCQKLAHLHRAGWVYADLKPENIVVTTDERGLSVRLFDFGFAHNRYAAKEEAPKQEAAKPEAAEEKAE